MKNWTDKWKHTSHVIKAKQKQKTPMSKPKSNISHFRKKKKKIGEKAFANRKKPKRAGYHSNKHRDHTKKPAFLQQKQQTFRKPPWKFAGFICFLMIIILGIPAGLVLPFDQDESSRATAVKTSASPARPVPEESSLTVSVMREQSDRIEDVPLETYVARVVASEMPAEFEMEALKAQAMAARTYIVSHLLYEGEDTESDVTDTVKHQVYKDDAELRAQMEGDFHENMDKVERAAAETSGKIITYNDTIITPAYFSTSNGYTEDAGEYWENDIPYLKSVESPWDKDTPKFMDQKIYTVAEVEQALDVSLKAKTPMDISRTDSGRVDTLTVGDKSLSGREVRENLELQSSDFTIEQKKDHVIFQTKGYGHGIGMSQYGANGMAKEGKDYDQIINHYYQDVTIQQLEETAPALLAKEGGDTKGQ